MLKEIKTRPVIAPQPVLVIGTYDAAGVPDAMNVAWGCQISPNQVEINISGGHKTTDNLRKKQAFTLHIGDAERVELADYFGIASGKKVDKFTQARATASHGKMVDAPVIEEFVLAMECRVVSMEDNGDGLLRVVGEVVRTVADDTILDAEGKVDYGRLHPIVFDSEHNTYRTVGESIAPAFEVGKELML